MRPDLRSPLTGIDELDPIGLESLITQADLSRRFDAKYVLPVHKLPDLIELWAPRMRVLDLDGDRHTDYASTYFDTPDLRTYRDHVQRRRRRFKIRTRHYGDPNAAMLEVKLKGQSGQTIKHRTEQPDGDWTWLGPASLAFIDQTLGDSYDMRRPDVLAPIATTRFRRTTLVDLRSRERVTIDQGLTIESGGRVIELGTQHAVLETKSANRNGAAQRELRERGLRPDRVSKYCLGIVASREDVRGNQWLPVLRRMASSVDW